MRYLLKGVENLNSHKNYSIDVYSSFIHNCLDLKATKIGEGLNEVVKGSEGLNKGCYIQTVEQYLVLKRSEP